MLFSLPSLSDLVQRARAAFRAEIPGTDAWLWPNNIGPTAKVLAGSAFEIFGRLDYVGSQAFVQKADLKYLLLHGGMYGLARMPAAPAAGTVTLTATAALAVAPGAVFQRSDGAGYAANAGALLTGPGALQIAVTATSSGAAGAAQALTPLAVASGVTGAGASTAIAAVGAAAITGGLDLEEIEAYRARILFRKRNPPQGGAPADYVQWGGQVAGVTRVFVERLYNGPGSLRAFLLYDDLFPLAGGVANAGTLAAAQSQMAALYPGDAQVAVAAPQAQSINIVISGLTPNTGPVQEAVRAELRDTFRRLGQVSGMDSGLGGMSYLATPFVFSVSWIWQAAANASGDQRHVLISPAADIVIAPGSIPVLGAVTFT